MSDRLVDTVFRSVLELERIGDQQVRSGHRNGLRSISPAPRLFNDLIDVVRVETTDFHHRFMTFSNGICQEDGGDGLPLRRIGIALHFLGGILVNPFNSELGAFTLLQPFFLNVDVGREVNFRRIVRNDWIEGSVTVKIGIDTRAGSYPPPGWCR